MSSSRQDSSLRARTWAWARRVAALCAVAIAASLLAAGARAQSVASLAVAQVTSDGTVYAVARQADGRIVIGGRFALVNGTPRHNVARLNADGSLDATWAPDADGIVYAVAIDGAGNVYAGGQFQSIGGLPRQNLAKLAGTGNGAADPAWNPDVLGSVFALALDGQGSLYAGGYYVRIGGVTQRHLAKLSTAGTGAVDAAWAPDPNNDVRAIVVDPSGNVYAGGDFTAIGTAQRGYIARLAGSGTGAADAVWAPNANGAVLAIALDGVGNVYVGGDFTRIADEPRSRIAKLLASGTGPAIPGWAPGADDTVDALSVSIGRLYVGGSFTKIGGASRANLVRLFTGSGAVDDTWAPVANRAVRALALDGSATLYAGGLATATAPYVGFTAIDMHGVANNAWSQTLLRTGTVYAVARDPSGHTVLGGIFQYMGDGTPRSNLARLNADGTLDAQWAPNPDGPVYALAVGSSIHLYVGGAFRNVGGAPRARLARLGLFGTGDADPSWKADADGDVFALAVALAQYLYVGGDFHNIAGAPRERLAKLRTIGPLGPDERWAPNPNGPVYALAVGNGLYVGGSFARIGNQIRSMIAKVDIDATGTVDPDWAPVADSSVNALALGPDGRVYAGGMFTKIGGVARKHIARIADQGTGVVDPDWAPDASGDVYAIAANATGVYAGGIFTTIGGQARGRVAKLSLTGTGAADPAWSANADDEVNALLVDSAGNLDVGGGFTTIAGRTSAGYALIIPR